MTIVHQGMEDLQNEVGIRIQSPLYTIFIHASYCYRKQSLKTEFQHVLLHTSCDITILATCLFLCLKTTVIVTKKNYWPNANQDKKYL